MVLFLSQGASASSCRDLFTGGTPSQKTRQLQEVLNRERIFPGTAFSFELDDGTVYSGRFHGIEGSVVRFQGRNRDDSTGEVRERSVGIPWIKLDRVRFGTVESELIAYSPSDYIFLGLRNGFAKLGRIHGFDEEGRVFFVGSGEKLPTLIHSGEIDLARTHVLASGRKLSVDKASALEPSRVNRDLQAELWGHWDLKEIGKARALEEQLEKALADEQVVSWNFLGRGAQSPLIVQLESGIRALAKPESSLSNAALERAAYLVDRILGLYLVPTTVVREWEGVRWVFQFWVEDARTLGIREYVDRPRSLREQLLSHLLSNFDRHGNTLLHESEREIGIDFAQGLMLPMIPAQLEGDLPRIRAEIDRLRELTPENWREILGRVLEGEQIDTFLENRSAVLELF